MAEEDDGFDRLALSYVSGGDVDQYHSLGRSTL